MRLFVWSAAILLAAPPLGAQVGRGGDPRSQLQLEAATLESRGDLEGAESSLRRLLELEPTASGTIFALERVLTAKNERSELRPLVQAFLAQSPSVEVMALFQELSASGITIALVTHEPDIASHAARVIVVRDGLIRSDTRQTPATARRAAGSLIDR